MYEYILYLPRIFNQKKKLNVILYIIVDASYLLKSIRDAKLNTPFAVRFLSSICIQNQLLLFDLLTSFFKIVVRHVTHIFIFIYLKKYILVLLKQ